MRPTSNKIVRKPLTVTIVTLSALCRLTDMSRWWIQRIKAMLLCKVNAMLCIDTEEMKIQKHAMHFNATFVDTVDTGVCGFYT